jgi:hypothetical protein
VHGGDRVRTYSALLPGGPAPTWQHAGRSNVGVFLRRLAPTFPSPSRLVVAGASGGGFGALANYERLREQWPAARGYLVDDSAPPLVGDAIPPSTRSAWYASWNLGASLDPFCPDCRGDLSAALREIARRHPADRIALSRLADEVSAGSTGRPRAAPAIGPMSRRVQAELRRLRATVVDPAPNAPSSPPAATDARRPGAIATPAPGLTA